MSNYNFEIMADALFIEDSSSKEPIIITELEEAYTLLKKVVEFIKLKETSNDEQN